jgi:2-phosphosulfolactate phosphatase
MTQAHCEWGLSGLHALRGFCPVLVAIAALSFCTAMDVAVARGARICRFRMGTGARGLSLSPAS